jgi:hypothetical protein
MPAVEIIMPDIAQAVRDALQRKIDAALAVADKVGELVNLTALGDGVDVNGAPLTPKQPRPKRNPRNNPRATLVGAEQGQTHMLDKSRWTVERIDDFTAAAVYSPPDYFPYVIEKRPWLTYDAMNSTVRAEIEALMRQAIVETE